MNGGSPQLADYLRAIRRRWRIVILLALVVTGTALGLSMSATRQYDASAQLLFKPEDQVDRLLDPGGAESEDPERVLNTGVELIRLDAIADRVRRRVGLDTTNEKLLEKLEIDFNSDSDIVTLTVRDPDAALAADIVNAFALEYTAYRQGAARATLEKAAEVAESEYQSLSPEDQVSAEGEALRARRRQLRITAALQTGGVEVVRRATVPTDPSRPRPKLSGALGLVLGLGLGLIAALTLEFTDRRLRREEDVEDLFELPILASIPPPPRRGGDHHVEREAYGLLAASVRYALPNTKSNVLMVTSPGASDGKTSVTLGLARALTRLGLRVIAIEADLRRPRFAQHAPLGESAGLTGLLMEPGPIALQLVWLDATSLHPVTEENLRDGLAFAVLPAGDIPPHPQRLLSRSTMRALIEQARSLADVVLIDTPPIGTVNDAITLARIVDSALIVAKLDQTTKDASHRALRALRGLNASLVGIVITNAPDVRQDDYYYRAEPEATVPLPDEAARR